MAENQNYIGVAMGLDVTDLKAGLSEANKQIQLANSEFKAASSGLDDFTKSTEGLSAKVKQLDTVLTAQKSKLAGLQAEYEKVAREQGENSEAARKLKVQINNQQAVVNKTQKEFDNYSDTLRQAEDGTIDLEKVTVGANGKIKNFGDTAKDAGEKVSKVGDSSKKTGVNFSGLSSIATGVVAGIAAIGAAAVAAATALGGAAVKSAEYADNILTMSTVTGISTDKLQEYSYASELVDVSVETLTKSMAKNIKSMSTVKGAAGAASVDMEKLGKAQTNAANAALAVESAQIKYNEAVKKSGEGSAQAQQAAISLEKAKNNLAQAEHEVAVASEPVAEASNDMAKAYAQLGVAVHDADGNLRDGETVYWEIIDALGKMENETERDALAMQILGKSAQELNPLIEAGSERMKELGEEARTVGAVMSAETLDSLGAFDDSIQRLKGSASAAKNALGTVLLPEMMSITEAGGNIITEFTNQLNNSGGGLSGLIEAFKGIAPMVKDILTNLAVDVVKTASDIIPMAVEALVQGITTTAPLLLDAIMPQIPFLLESVLSQLPLILETVISMVASVAESLGQMLPTLIPIVIDTVIMLVETLLDNVDLLIDAGIALLIGLADGLIVALPRLIDKIPVIIEKLLDAVLGNLPKLVEAGIMLTVQLAVGLIKAIPQLVSKIPQIIKSVVNGFKDYYSNMGNVGLNLLKGIWQGIKDGASWLKDKITGFAGNVSDWFKSTFKINSPSKLMEDEVGRYIGEGVGVGVLDSIPTVKKQLGKFAGFVTDNLGDIKGGLSVDASGTQYSGRTVGGTVINAGLTVHYNGSLSRKQIKQLENDNYAAIRTRLRAEGAI